MNNTNKLPIYIDIDGTLTDSGVKGGKAIPERIESIKKLIKEGNQVIIWSANGTEYAKTFADTNNIKPLVCVGKPRLIIDDNPTIRPNFMQLIKAPEYLNK